MNNSRIPGWWLGLIGLAGLLVLWWLGVNVFGEADGLSARFSL
ncbi:MAG: ABC transporter permease, partial [Pseudomonas paracarnis]